MDLAIRSRKCDIELWARNHVHHPVTLATATLTNGFGSVMTCTVVGHVVSADPRSGGLSVQSMGGADDFEAWYRAEYQRLVRLLVRLGSKPQDAVDLACEAFSRALDRWPRVSQMESPTGWVYRVALNLLRRSQRRRTIERRLLARQVPPPAVEPVPVWDAVARLPRRQRTAVVLHYLLDLPTREVATLMGIKEGTVAATLHAARTSLATALQDREERP